MSELGRLVETLLRSQMFRSSTFEGSNGAAWFVGIDRDAPSIARFYSGEDARLIRNGRTWRHAVSGMTERFAKSGGISIIRPPEPDPVLLAGLPGAIAVPELVDIHTDLPDDVDVLREQLLTSTTKEDFRRIRKANFEYRITNETAAVREFHARHYAPLVRHQFPDDGRIKPLAKMIGSIDPGGEIVCADIDGEWVAGIFNIAHEEHYALMSLGIRDADEAVRHKRAVAALIVRSLERGVELGKTSATLGRSLPFLGKGPVWFKAKWNGTLSRKSGTRDMFMFLDIRQPAVRRMLAASPIVHMDVDELVVSTWLEHGDQALKSVMREIERYPAISRWHVLGEPEVLGGAADSLASTHRVVPIAITPRERGPEWLGELVRRATPPGGSGQVTSSRSRVVHGRGPENASD